MNKRRVLDIKPGVKLGKRTILERIPNKEKYSLWKFRCDCGNVGVANGSALRRGKGCKLCAFKHLRKSYGECSFNGLFLRYKHNALNRGFKFKLSKAQFRKLTKQSCVYCGEPPLQTHKGTTSFGEYLYNGIDRVDSNKDYTFKNSVTCCFICNRAKSNLSIVNFKEWIAKIIKHNRR